MTRPRQPSSGAERADGTRGEDAGVGDQGDPVVVSEHGAVRVVLLNRPETRNAADAELHRALTEVWERVRADDGARAVVLTGAGRAFCAGGSIELLDAMASDIEARTQVLAEAAALVRNMLSVEIPIVAAVNGPAVGLGCSLASLCDIVLMDENAYLADPHVQLGLVAADGGAISWPLLVGLLRAKEHLLLGSRIPASEALALGLANRVVPGGEVLKAAIDVATQLASLPPQAVRATKQLLNTALVDAVAARLDGALAAEAESFDTVELRASLDRMLHRRTDAS